MELLQHLNTLMEFPSRSEDRECCKAALRYVLELAKEFGLETKLGKYGDVGIVDLGEGSETVGVLVHVDVVSEGNPGLWNYPPFHLTEEDGILYGRGIVDDKGPVIACLYALKKIKEEHIPLKKKLRLIVGTSEEIYWSDMEHYKEEFDLPDYGFSPDGNFPVYNSESGYMDVELVFNEMLPKGLTDFRGGSAANAIPSQAFFRRNGQEVSFTGKSAHSSTPEQGINAINLLCEAAEAQYGFAFAKMVNRYFPKDCHESLLPIRKTDGSFASAGDLTMVPTLLHQEGKNIVVNFNVRQDFSIPCSHIIEALEELKDEYGFTVRVKEAMEAIFVDEHLPWLKRIQQVTEQYGMDPKCRYAAGCSYAKSMPNFICWGPVFPDDPDCAHMENEQQSLRSFLRTLDIYTDYLILEGQSEPIERKDRR